KTQHRSRDCCSPPKHWSRRFLRRKKLLQCLQAEWAAWIIKPNDRMNSNSRTRKGPAVLFLARRLVRSLLRKMEKKNQHVIPECYLKSWCDLSTPKNYTPYVWVHTRDGSSTRKRAPQKLFTETDFYTVKLDDGSRSLVIEDSFSVIEDRFARLRNNSLKD